MLILGIETSCDETAAAVVRDGRGVLSNVIASQDDLHAEYRGVVPEIASRAHAQRILPVVRAAINQAGITLPDIDAVAVGHRPGLIGSLLVGVAAAKALAWSLNKSLVGVDHVHAHLYAGCLQIAGGPEGQRARSEQTSAAPPSESGHPAIRPSGNLFPALGLVVSGGHTALYRCDSPTTLTRLGATIDDALGEAYDKAATILGLPYPGGPNLDKLAHSPGADDRAHDLPVSRLARDSLDLSFSGLKTAVLYTVRGIPGPGGVFQRDHTALTDAQKADIAASFQRAAVKAIILKLQRALEKVSDDPTAGGPPLSLLAGGGVTSNSRLRAELQAFAREHNLQLRLPEPRFCVDNAAMIAGLGFHLLREGRTSDLSLPAIPTTAC